MAIAVSIIVSICAAMAVVRIFGDGGHKWRRDERALAVLARRFARDWEDPAERRTLAADLADAVGGGVRITDPRGQTVEALAWREECHWSDRARRAPARDAQRLLRRHLEVLSVRADRLAPRGDRRALADGGRRRAADRQAAARADAGRAGDWRGQARLAGASAARPARGGRR